MNPIIETYRSLKNLKFIGLTEGSKKSELLNSCWGLINTSVHEALPVTFLEAFSYGKTIISCQNPDGLVEKYGYYTGELLGEGLDEKTLGIFEDKIRQFLGSEWERKEKGIRAKEYVEKNHTFDKFEEQLNLILESEGIAR